MNKLTSSIAAVALTAVILAVPVSALALSVNTPTMITDQTQTATAGVQPADVSMQTPVDYQLPYPGLLPDSPLYFIKQVRDWVLDKLIMDPVKKTEFYILQGDKRLVMGTMLDTNGKTVLGEQVISKGEKYMNNAEQALLTMKSQGKDVPSYVVDHLTQALAKHAEVISGEIAKAQGAQKAGLTASLTLVSQLQGDLAKLK